VHNTPEASDDVNIGHRQMHPAAYRHTVHRKVLIYGKPKHSLSGRRRIWDTLRCKCSRGYSPISGPWYIIWRGNYHPLPPSNLFSKIRFWCLPNSLVKSCSSLDRDILSFLPRDALYECDIRYRLSVHLSVCLSGTIRYNLSSKVFTSNNSS